MAHIGGKLGEEGCRRHDKAHVAVPAMPGPRFAMIEPEIGFCSLKAFFDGPAQTCGAREFG